MWTAAGHVAVGLATIPCISKIPDDLTGLDGVTLFQVGREWFVFAQVGVIVISFGVVAADADAPTTVLIPAEFLDYATLDRDYWRANASVEVVTEVFSPKPVVSPHAKVVKLAVPVASCDWMVTDNFATVSTNDSVQHGVKDLDMIDEIFIVDVALDGFALAVFE